MDRREPPPTGVPEDRPVDGLRRRFPGLSRTPAVRHVARARLAAALAVGLAAVGLAYAGGSHALKTVREWLHASETYRVPFRSIQLEPPPPAWYRPGSEALLDEVRKAGGYDESVSLLDVDLEELAKTFAKYHWVEQVQRVEKSYPNQIVVKLAYREPVMVATWGKPEMRQSTADFNPIAVDGDGVLLPYDEVEPTFREGLLMLATRVDYANGSADEVPRPFHPEYGIAWKSEPEEAPKKSASPEATPQLAAARLAREIRSRRDGDAVDAELSARFSTIMLGIGGTNLFLETRPPQTLVLWGKVAGPDAPTPEAKWSMLRDYVQQNGSLSLPLGPDKKPDNYLVFGRSKLEPKNRPKKPGGPGQPGA